MGEPTSSLAEVAVLVVDDDPASGRLVSVLLEREGCETRTAGSAEEALAIMERFAPRVLVLDLLLPAMSGLALARRLKETPTTPALVIIAVSSHHGEKAAEAALNAGCVIFVCKPIDAIGFPQLVLDAIGSSPPPVAENR